MLLIFRWLSQLARRLDVWGDPDCTWVLRATRNSDEARHPESIRKSVRVSGRRLICGSPLAPESVDHWPGVKAENRLVVPRGRALQ